MARTRLLWISNSRSGSKMAAYNYGVDAVKELIGALEDIRRFDAVIAVASGEVPYEIINKRHNSTIPHEFTSDLSSHLVSWAWSRKSHQIFIERDAEDEILMVSNRMGAKYSSSCPIVEPSDQRLKIARLSVALAARTFSTEDGYTLIVRKCHVEMIEEFLDRIYASPALGYLEYSKRQCGETKLKNTTDIKTLLKNMPNHKDTVESLIESELINPQDLMNYTEWPLDRCNEVIGALSRMGCLKRSRHGGYKKTSAFIDLLKELGRDDSIPNKTYHEMVADGEV